MEREALVTALRLLPRLPARVAVIDATEAKPGVREHLLRLDAFILKGSAVIYVVKQSALLRGAVARSPLHAHALAAVLWHEVAHAEGADEHEARTREQALWTSFVRDQRVDRTRDADLCACRRLRQRRRGAQEVAPRAASC